MLIGLRKNIIKLPVTFLWLWLVTFFADAANLDDFFFKDDVIHTDIPDTSLQDGSVTHLSDLSNADTGNSQLNISKVTHQHIKLKKYAYDEDSPSLAPDIDASSEGICSALQNDKQFIKSISISKPLYLEFCTLLI